MSCEIPSESMPDEKVWAHWAVYISIKRIGLKHIFTKCFINEWTPEICKDISNYVFLNVTKMKKVSLLKLTLNNYWYILFDVMTEPLNRIMQGQNTVTKDDIDNMKTLNIMYTCET